MENGSVEVRLERLEAENRRWRRLGAALLCAGAGLAALGQEAPPAPPQAPPQAKPGVVDAQTFVVRDAAGNPRATFGLLVPKDPNDPVAQAAAKGGLPCFILRDSEGGVRVSLLVNQDGVSTLQFFDRGGKARASLGTAADGTPTFALHDARGAEAVAMAVQGNGDASLEVKRGMRGFSINATEKVDPSLLVRDDAGKVRATLLPGGILFIDSNSVRRAGMVLGEDGAPQIALADKDGKILHRAP